MSARRHAYLSPSDYDMTVSAALQNREKAGSREALSSLGNLARCKMCNKRFFSSKSVSIGSVALKWSRLTVHPLNWRLSTSADGHISGRLVNLATFQTCNKYKPFSERVINWLFALLAQRTF
jgi:hypothetical protein